MAKKKKPKRREPEQTTDQPLIFLDLDGVVCCNMHGELERDKLIQVKKICDAAQAKVVLSTDWRRRPELINLGCAGVERRAGRRSVVDVGRARREHPMSGTRLRDGKRLQPAAHEQRRRAIEGRSGGVGRSEDGSGGGDGDALVRRRRRAVRRGEAGERSTRRVERHVRICSHRR